METTDQEKRQKPHRFHGDEFADFTPPHLSDGGGAAERLRNRERESDCER